MDVRIKLEEDMLISAGKEYQWLKMQKNPYLPPEVVPDVIQSDQIKAVIHAVSEELATILEMLM